MGHLPPMNQLPSEMTHPTVDPPTFCLAYRKPLEVVVATGATTTGVVEVATVVVEAVLLVLLVEEMVTVVDDADVVVAEVAGATEVEDVFVACIARPKDQDSS